MELETISDPLGDATMVTLDLPRRDGGHFKPWDELSALHRAGLETVSAAFIDEPTGEHNRWPSADAAFLEAITTSTPESTLTPLVWARISTAPRYPTVRTAEDEQFPFLARAEVPREPQWPADFTGIPTQTLAAAMHDDPGSQIVQHIPPGDGWHRIAWVRQDFGDASMSSLLCECSLQYVITSHGQMLGLRGDADCAYRPVTAYLRSLSFQQEYPQATPHALREMIDAALAGTWLGQHTSGLWEPHLYLQTVSAVLNVTMPWALADEAVKAKLISLDGAIVGLP